MKKWLLSELFYPLETTTGYFMTKIAEKLSESEPYGINVICGPETYESSSLYSSSKLHPGISLYRVKIPALDKNKLIQRSLRMLVLALKMSFKLLRLAKKNDRVFIVTNPAPLLVCISCVKRLIKFDLIIIVHDVFPENMLPGKMIKQKSLGYKVLKSVFNWAYRQADKIICVGEDIKELMLKKTNFKDERVKVIRNWADCDQIYPLHLSQIDIINYYNLPQLKDKIIIQFAGNLGRLQALTSFLKVFNKANNDDLALILIGEGAIKQSLIESILKNDIKNVYFIQSLSRDEQNKFLNAAHIGLVSLNQGMYGLGVPSKSYNIWAAGKPILFVGDDNSEIARNIESMKIGWAFNWTEEHKLESFLKQLKFSDTDVINKKGGDARRAALNYFDRKVILEQYDGI